MSDPDALFDLPEPRSRFTKDHAELARALQWYAQITTELQRRVLEASKYVRSHTGDRTLLGILEGSHRPDPIETVVNERLTHD